MKEMYITHEGKRTSKSNLRLLENNGITVLMSYATPVAFKDDSDNARCHKWFFTSHKYSPTTSKQITRFLNAYAGGRADGIEVNQHHIDSAYRNMSYDDNYSLLSARAQ
jgi:hypothetical protein